MSASAPDASANSHNILLSHEDAIAIADKVFIQIHQECLLPRGLQPRDLFESIDADASGEITLDEFREGLFQKFGMSSTKLNLLLFKKQMLMGAVI